MSQHKVNWFDIHKILGNPFGLMPFHPNSNSQHRKNAKTNADESVFQCYMSVCLQKLLQHDNSHNEYPVAENFPCKL